MEYSIRDIPDPIVLGREMQVVVGIPEHPDGHINFNHPDYGQRYSGEIEIRGLGARVIESVSRGDYSELESNHLIADKDYPGWRSVKDCTVYARIEKAPPDRFFPEEADRYRLPATVSLKSFKEVSPTSEV